MVFSKKRRGASSPVAASSEKAPSHFGTQVVEPMQGFSVQADSVEVGGPFPQLWPVPLFEVCKVVQQEEEV